MEDYTMEDYIESCMEFGQTRAHAIRTWKLKEKMREESKQRSRIT